MRPLKLNWVNESADLGPDPLVRAPIRRLTNSPLISWGVYCEQVYASTDGRRIAFMRRESDGPSPIDVWVADLVSGEIARVGPAALYLMASTPLMDSIYYIRPEGEKGRVLVRLNLATLELDDVFAFGDCPAPGTPAVSSDGRWFASHKRLHDSVFGLYRVDLRTSRWEFFHEEKYICNTHLQFEPSEGRDLLVQQNRGCEYDAAGRQVKAICEEGCALYVVDIDGKNQRFLPLGPPHTGHVDGHQCWIGRSKRVLAAISYVGAHIISTDLRDAVPVMSGFPFVHVSASADGRFMAGETGGPRGIVLGSLETGRAMRLCEAVCSRSGGHETWEEPYIVPGNRHVVFNSERTGHAELYAATVPDHVMAYLTTGA